MASNKCLAMNLVESRSDLHQYDFLVVNRENDDDEDNDDDDNEDDDDNDDDDNKDDDNDDNDNEDDEDRGRR